MRGEPPLWLAYCSFAGFLVLAVAALLMPFAPSPWVAVVGMAGGAVWVVFGALFRRSRS